jgi:hypothetical protein
MAINIILFIILAACFASLFNNGLWSNTLMLVNVLTAGLLAMNYFEPLAGWLETQVSPSLTYVWDFVAIWLIFIVSMAALRAATDYMSPVKVRFLPPVDKFGGYVVALWTSWVLVCFTTATLHTAPLARNFLGFQTAPQDKMMGGFAPDRQWLGWTHRESKGAMCRLGELSPFDPYGDFILRYGKRREDFEGQLTLMSKGGTGGAGGSTELPPGINP